MHSHIFQPTSKKDICYCKICNKLSYNGSICQSLPIDTFPKFDIDPFKLKYKPMNAVANYNLENHQKYLEHKRIGISKIRYLTNTFGLKSMVFFKAVNFMNQIYLENNISTDDIESIASLCVLLVAEFNECCLPSIYDEYMTKEESDILFHNHSKKIKEDKIKHKSNLHGLFHYIKKNVNNYKYWEVLCLKKLNYDLGKYSAYDYLILFFELGLFFWKANINILDKLKYCINILDFITNNKKSCDYSQYTLAMSIIKVALENNNYFDKDIYKYIYGVDLSKKKYINCSNMIKTNLILYYNYNLDKSKNLIYNYLINNQSQLKDKCLNISEINRSNQINRIANNVRSNEDNYQDNNNKILNIINKIKIIMLNSGIGLYNEKSFFENLRYIINNNNIVINNFINNNININNNNFLYQNYIFNNINNIINNKVENGQNNNSNYLFIKMKDLEDNQIKNINESN